MGGDNSPKRLITKKPKLSRGHKNYTIRGGGMMKVACFRLFKVGAIAVLSLGLFANLTVVEAKPVDSQQQQYFAKTLSNLPFIKNNGQIQNKDIEYFTKTFAGTVAITRSGDILHVFGGHGANKSKGWVISESLIGSSTPDLQGEGAAPVRLNYITTSQSDKKGEPNQRHKSAAYQEISFGEVYSGIELRLHARGENVEKLFFLSPGASADTIKIKMEGVNTLGVNVAGQLVAETGLGSVSFTAPIAYQSLKDGTKKSVPVAYHVAGSEYGFTLGGYDRSRPVVIDPMLASAFVETNGWTVAKSMSIDSAGNVYVVGQTEATDFPATPGAYDLEFNTGPSDGFVAKFDNNLKLLAATYISDCWFLGVVVDADGNVFAGGATRSDSYPTTSGAYDENFNGMADAVIAKLDGDLQDLLASTLVGGADWWDEAGGIDVDADGYVFITGWVDSADTPTTTGAYDEIFNGGGGDGYIAKFSNDLQTLEAATFIGGSSRDGSRGITIANDGSVYIAGRADSLDFPTTDGAYDTEHNGDGSNVSGDVFVAKFDNQLTVLQAATLFGGKKYEKAESIAIGPDGTVYVSGRTDSTDLPIPGDAYDSNYNGGNEDVFIARFSADLSILRHATYFGGSRYESGWRVLPDAEGNVYISGTTYSEDLPVTEGAYSTSFNGGSNSLVNGEIQGDAYVAKFDAALQSLMASTFIGAYTTETGRRLALDAQGNVFLSGFTHSIASDVAAQADNAVHSEFLRPDGEMPRMFVVKLDGDLSAAEPGTFTFNYIKDAALGSLVTSNAVVISGLSAPADITITGGEYSINDGEYTNLPGEVNNTDSVQVRLIASSSYQTAVAATVTIGDFSDIFSVATLAYIHETVSADDEANVTQIEPDDSSSTDIASNSSDGGANIEETASADDLNITQVEPDDSSSTNIASNSSGGGVNIEETAPADDLNITQVETEDSSSADSVSNSSGGGAVSLLFLLLLGLVRFLPRIKDRSLLTTQ